MIVKNLLSILILIFVHSEVSVKSDFPVEMRAGEEREVTVTIQKGDVTGPLRLKITPSMAEHIEITSITTEGAAFLRRQGAYTFVWIAAPEKEVITLKYKLKVSEAASGNIKLSTLFSYTVGDERKSLEESEKNIYIKDNKRKKKRRR